ncbi:hypothetical protein [Alkaliphilus sp. B6464]|uniref:hypothetical protein n=1 Tax=Alkaliphilus sp. B6464 TaxID=2731219 RepID=UPI001BA6AD9E|nr:hypothetical protein [Alkaliphilus sp. B6464]QUH21985.1 hypothetical protein HYG84_18950 [Alkaliphilus sp. B6464]
MKKLMNRKGSSEIVSVVLLVVVIGGLALAVTGTFSKQTNSSLNAGMTQQTNQLGTNYQDAATQRNATSPTLQ